MKSHMESIFAIFTAALFWKMHPRIVSKGFDRVLAFRISGPDNLSNALLEVRMLVRICGSQKRFSSSIVSFLRPVTTQLASSSRLILSRNVWSSFFSHVNTSGIFISSSPASHLTAAVDKSSRCKPRPRLPFCSECWTGSSLPWPDLPRPLFSS